MKNTEIRNELRVPLTLAVFARSHPFLHGVTEEDLVRDPIQERVPCGHHSERERYPRFALSVANEGEKFRSCWTPYHKNARGGFSILYFTGGVVGRAARIEART